MIFVEDEKDCFVRCRDGKDYEIFPALIKDRKKIRHYTAKFNSDTPIVNLLTPDLKKLAKAQEDGEKLDIDDSFSDEPYEAMLEIFYLAFGKQVEIEKLEEIIDVSIARKVLNIFYDVSGYDKKKVMSPRA